MREIKFKVWDKFAQQWVILNLEEISRLDNAYFDYENWNEFTGLKDKKGK